MESRNAMKPLVPNLMDSQPDEGPCHLKYVFIKNIIHVHFIDVCGCRFLQELSYSTIYFQTEKND